jgi:hypothetical protein
MVTAEPVIPQNATAESRGNGVDGVAGVEKEKLADVDEAPAEFAETAS